MNSTVLTISMTIMPPRRNVPSSGEKALLLCANGDGLEEEDKKRGGDENQIEGMAAMANEENNGRANNGTI
jgi:hypothetical protein